MRPVITVSFTHNRLPRLIAQAPSRVGAVVQRTVRAVEREAKVLCPVDTGRLRGSIHGQMTGPTEGEVGTDVEYAQPVHDGHHTASGSYVPGQPYLTPALELARPAFVAAMTALLRGEGLA